MLSNLIDSWICDLLTSLFGFVPIDSLGAAVGGACMNFTGALRGLGL